MRKIIFIIIIFLSLASCKDNKFDDIDFIAYSYRQFDSDNPDFEKEYRVTCPYYLHVDRWYNCQVIKGETYADSGIYYFESKNDPELKSIIKEIINKSKELDKETDFRPHPNLLMLYDGSDLEIRIKTKDKSKIIHFWQDQKACLPFEKLFFYSIKLVQNGMHSAMNPKICEKKQEFINYVIKSDSILRPLPPLPPKGLTPEFIPPKVIE